MNCLCNSPEPPDLCGTGPQVKSVIYSAWKVKHGCEKEHTKSYHSVHLSQALHAARTDGVLGDVLKEAVRYRILREVVCRADEDDYFEEVFVESNKCGFLKELVVNCRRFSVPLVKAAINCGLLGDVLRTALKEHVLTNLLNRVYRGGAMTVLLDTGILGDVLQEAFDERWFSTLIMEAQNNETLDVLLIGAGNAGTEILDAVLDDMDSYKGKGVVKVLPKAIERGRLGDILKRGLRKGKLSMIVQAAARFDMLDVLLIEAEKVGPEVLYAALDCLITDEKLAFIGMKLREGFSVGKLRKAINKVKYSNTPWEDPYGISGLDVDLSLFESPPITRDEILQAAENQDLLEEVLEAERMNEWFEVLHTLITCILLLFVTVNKKPRTHNLGTSSHRKSVIDHVTIRSGDIEKNPGPCTLKLNDWLKSMHLFIVNLIHGYEGKRISWKKLGLPDPNNSKFDHSELLVLFPDQLLQDAEARIPAANYEEFQLLKAYVHGEKPDLSRIQHLMDTRKLTAEFLNVSRKFRSQPQAVQQGVIDNLRLANSGLQLTLLEQQQETTDGEETDEVARNGVGGVDSQSNGPSGTGSVNQTENGLQTDHCGELVRHESSVDEKVADEQSSDPGEKRGTSDQLKFPHLEGIVLPGLSGETACEGDLTEIYDWLCQFLETDCDFEHDAAVEGATETQAVWQSGTDDTDNTEDPLQQLLDQHASCNFDKASNDTMQAAHSSTQDTTLAADTPDPCQDDTTGTCTSLQDQQTSDTTLPDQHTQWGYLVSNLKLFTGMEELDKREYNAAEIDKLSRKRKWSQNAEFEIVKKAKTQ